MGEGKYAPKPHHAETWTRQDRACTARRQGHDREKAKEAVESQSGVKWEVAADLKDCERFFPIPTTTKKPDLVIWNEE